MARRIVCERLEDRIVPAFTLDTTFAGGGLATAHFGAGDDAVRAVVQQTDGKIVLAGFAKVGSDTDFAVVRLNADGTRDTSFGTSGNGRVTVDVSALSAIPTFGATDMAEAVAIDGFGRIVVAGSAFVAGSSTQDRDFAVLRLNANGTRDTSFNGNGVRTFDFGTGDDSAFGVSVLNNGDLIVGGSAQIGSDDDFAVIRLNDNGSLDTAFGNSGKQTVHFGFGDDIALETIVRSNGRIVLGGTARIGGDDDFAVAQLTSGGFLDSTFGGGDGIATYDFQLENDIAFNMGLFGDGSIGLVGGAKINGDADFAMVKFTPNGVLDTSFGNKGTFTHHFGFGGDVALAATGDATGGIILVGIARIQNDDDFGIIRITGNGQLDTSFGDNGQLTADFSLENDAAFGVIVQNDGKIVVAGSASISGDTDFGAVRFTDEQVLINTGTNDSDGDGLLDSWETTGIDVNNDGIIDLNLAALGANPFRPDIFVEIDTMVGRTPSNEALQLVVTAFANSPVSTTTSGGTFNGIALHPIISDTNIPLIDWPVIDSQFFPVDFGSTRAIFFGDAADRASPNAANILAARNLAFRYSILANTFAGRGFSGIAQGIITQNFVVSLGTQLGNNVSSVNPVAVSIVAGTFMHELGHTLGLRHHGNEDTPNPSTDYISIMNYRFQFGIENPGENSQRLPNHPDYAPNISSVNPDWQKLVYNWRTGANANAGFDGARPAAVEDEIAVTIPMIPPPPATVPIVPPGTIPPVVVPPGSTTPPVVVPPGAIPPGTSPATVSKLSNQIAVGSGPGVAGVIRIVNSDGSVARSIDVFGGFTGGIRVAMADVNNDGVADVIAGTGPGRATSVQIFDGKTGTLLREINPFEASFTGGVYVAVGDVNGDGFADIAVTPDEGGGPRVRLFSGNGFGQIADFLGIEDPTFRGGARASIGDIDGDGKAELLIAAGFGGGPRLAVFKGSSLGSTPEKLFTDFFVFEQSLRNGVFIASGDIDGDGFAEVIAGGGPGGGPRVFALSGKDLLTGGLVQKANFFAGDTSSRGGVRISVANLDGDNRADLIAGSGTGTASSVTAYAGKTIPVDGVPSVLSSNNPFAGDVGGVFVG